MGYYLSNIFSNVETLNCSLWLHRHSLAHHRERRWALRFLIPDALALGGGAYHPKLFGSSQLWFGAAERGCQRIDQRSRTHLSLLLSFSFSFSLSFNEQSKCELWFSLIWFLIDLFVVCDTGCVDSVRFWCYSVVCCFVFLGNILFFLNEISFKTKITDLRSVTQNLYHYHPKKVGKL